MITYAGGCVCVFEIAWASLSCLPVRTHSRWCKRCVYACRSRMCACKLASFVCLLVISTVCVRCWHVIIIGEMSTSGGVAKPARDINWLFTGLCCLSLASDQRTPTQSVLSAAAYGDNSLSCSITGCQQRHQQIMFPVPKCAEARDVIQGFLVLSQNKHSFWPWVSLTVTTSELELGVFWIMSELVFRITTTDISIDHIRGCC